MRAALTDLGYRLFALSADAHGLTPQPPRDRYGYVNLVATKDPEHVRARLHRPQPRGAGATGMALPKRQRRAGSPHGPIEEVE